MDIRVTIDVVSHDDTAVSAALHAVADRIGTNAPEEFALYLDNGVSDSDQSVPNTAVRFTVERTDWSGSPPLWDAPEPLVDAPMHYLPGDDGVDA